MLTTPQSIYAPIPCLFAEKSRFHPRAPGRSVVSFLNQSIHDMLITYIATLSPAAVKQVLERAH